LFRLTHVFDAEKRNWGWGEKNGECVLFTYSR